MNAIRYLFSFDNFILVKIDNLQHIIQQKCNKSRPDEIHMNIYKENSKELMQYLTRIINISLRNVREILKIATVVPIREFTKK